MKALTHYRYGPPSVLQFEEVPKPTPNSKEILVEVHASTVNRTDTGLRSAHYFISRLFTGLLKPKNNIQGCEFAGIVKEVGSDADTFKKGDSVYGFDDSINGGHAEYPVIKASKMVDNIPKGTSFTTAAAAIEGANYALHYTDAANLGTDDHVLVCGATGNIGSAAVQILKEKRRQSRRHGQKAALQGG